MPRVVLAMSGGVDSSVAAALLCEQGYDVVGLFMRHGQAAPSECSVESPASQAADEGSMPASAGPAAGARAVLPLLPVLSNKQGCCTASDAQDARRVADKLDIPFYALNFEAEFERIIDYFVDEYTAGRTPNPCVMCNNWLKFGSLWDYAQGIGADFIATGHYARLEALPGDDRFGPWPALRRGIDAGKDQAYVLFGIRRELLPRLMFPIGGYRKSEIRERARRLGLRVAEKKDSQEICFVAGGRYADFIRQYRDSEPLAGEIVTTDGQVVGRHAGLENFTVGQRKGLGVAMGDPYYVVRLETDTRRVVIGRHEELAVRQFFASQSNWLIDEPREPFRCQVKVRYLSEPEPAWVVPLDGGRFECRLDRPKHGVAPGQAAVCFDQDRLLGGGWIE